jgi:hypothetical protein
MNLIRTPHETPSGGTGFLYRKHGSKSDDILHALNFAYVTGRVYLQENIVEDTSLLRRMKDAMTSNQAYVPSAFGGMPESFSM